MNTMRWMMRAKRWAQNPPSSKQVKFVLAIIAICLAIFAYDQLIGAPDWMTLERHPAKVKIK